MVHLLVVGLCDSAAFRDMLGHLELTLTKKRRALLLYKHADFQLPLPQRAQFARETI